MTIVQLQTSPLIVSRKGSDTSYGIYIEPHVSSPSISRKCHPYDPVLHVDFSCIVHAVQQRRLHVHDVLQRLLHQPCSLTSSRRDFKDAEPATVARVSSPGMSLGQASAQPSSRSPIARAAPGTALVPSSQDRYLISRPAGFSVQINKRMLSSLAQVDSSINTSSSP